MNILFFWNQLIDFFTIFIRFFFYLFIESISFVLFRVLIQVIYSEIQFVVKFWIFHYRKIEKNKIVIQMKNQPKFVSVGVSIFSVFSYHVGQDNEISNYLFNKHFVVNKEPTNCDLYWIFNPSLIFRLKMDVKKCYSARALFIK